MKTYRCDCGKENYSQRNNEINPNNTCNTTAMVMALDYAGYKFPTDYHPELKQPEDKLTYMCYFDDDISNYYRRLSLPMWQAWQGEMKRLKEKESNFKKWVFKDSYPPNEVHLVLSYAARKFIKKAKATVFREKASIKEIVEQLIQKKPVMVSVKFGNLNHCLTLVGVEVDDNNNPLYFYADDTYGKFDMETKTYQKVSGNDSKFKAEDLIPCLKEIDSKNKIAHFFNFPSEEV